MHKDIGGGVFLIDSKFGHDEFTAVYAVVADGACALIDTANGASLPHIERALEAIGVSADEVAAICLTHVHLDHAGGAGHYMRRFPRATLYVHARGARHMADPTKLEEATVAVYGAKLARELYGSLVPVESSRIVSLRGGEKIALGGRSLTAIASPGHAKHHVDYLLEDDKSIFTGDSFGTTHPHFAPSSHPPILPSTPPTQFDPEASIRTIDEIEASAPRRALLSHWGAIDGVATAAADLRRMLGWHLDAVIDAKGDLRHTIELLHKGFASEAEAHGWSWGDECRFWLDANIELSANGLVHWYEHDRRA